MHDGFDHPVARPDRQHGPDEQRQGPGPVASDGGQEPRRRGRHHDERRPQARHRHQEPRVVHGADGCEHPVVEEGRLRSNHEIEPARHRRHEEDDSQRELDAARSLPHAPERLRASNCSSESTTVDAAQFSST